MSNSEGGLSTAAQLTFNAAVLTFFGAAEGASFVLCGIGNPLVFRDQMEFKSFLLMKLFLSGVGASMLSQSILSIIDASAAAAGSDGVPNNKVKHQQSRFDKTRNYSNTRVPYSRAIPGCLMLGAGMYVAGSGPTMLPSQLFSNVLSAPYIFAGMLLGGGVYSAVENRLFGTGDQGCPRSSKVETALDGMLKLDYWQLAGPLGVAMIGTALGFEHFFPHSADMQRYGLSTSASTIAGCVVTPVIAGCVLGANQLPIRVISAGGQGGSTSVMRILATVSGGLVAGKYKIKNFGHFCQPLYVYGGTSLGAYLAYRYTLQAAAAASSVTATSGSGAAAAAAAAVVVAGYSPLVSVAGGALMQFGARFANGCTCGHGISGMSELSVTSIAGAMCIFAGGIGAGAIKSLMGF